MSRHVQNQGELHGAGRRPNRCDEKEQHVVDGVGFEHPSHSRPSKIKGEWTTLGQYSTFDNQASAIGHSPGNRKRHFTTEDTELTEKYGEEHEKKVNYARRGAACVTRSGYRCGAPLTARRRRTRHSHRTLRRSGRLRPARRRIRARRRRIAETMAAGG
jgi:hypothetical protein